MANGVKLSFSISVENLLCALWSAEECCHTPKGFLSGCLLDKQLSIFEVMVSNHMVWEAGLFLEMV